MARIRKEPNRYWSKDDKLRLIMKYLFFDIEGANCYNYTSKMCTFGYVITNEKFEMLSKVDVIMNPEAHFDKHIIAKKNECVSY